MASLLTRIIEGELPGRFVWRDDRAVAFLTINPVQPGHTLVVPRVEVDHWLDLDDETVSHLTLVARSIGRAQQAAFPCVRVGLLIAGFDVPHVHLHVLPLQSMADIDLARTQTNPDPADLDDAASRLRATLTAQGHTQARP